MKLARVVTGQQIMGKQTNHIATNQYLISILITQNGYSFFVLHTNENTIEICKAETLQQRASAHIIFNKIAEELKQNWVRKFKDANLQITYHHPYFALVPKHIYSPEFVSHYLKYNTKLYANDSISCDENADFDVCIPFVPYVNVHNELLNYYQTVDFTHSANTSLSWAKKHCQHQEGEHAFVFVQKEAFVLVMIKEGKLQFANYFEYQTTQDFAYYCLFALEQNDFNREEVKFSILGNISTEDELYNILYAYIKNVELISFEELNCNTKITTEQQHFLNSNPLLALELCESFPEN